MGRRWRYKLIVSLNIQFVNYKDIETMGGRGVKKSVQ